MGTRCVACGSNIPSWEFDTNICVGCRAMTCERCRMTSQSECPVCGSTGPPKTGTGISLALFILSLLAVGFAVMLGPIIIDGLSAESPAATAIADASPGQHVRLEGKIVSDTEVALDAAYNESHKHYRFLRHPLVLSSGDGSSSITLELREETIIYKGTHPSSDGKEGETSYHANDSVIAVGTVFTNGTGARWLRTEKLAPAGTNLEPTDLTPALVVFVAVFPCLIAGILAYWAHILRSNDRRVEAQGGMFKVRLPRNHEAAALSPIENLALPFFLKLGLVLLVVGLALAVPFILFLTGIEVRPGLNDISVILAVPALIVLVVASVLLQAFMTAPRSVAVDGRGFTLRYRGGRSEGFAWEDLVVVIRPVELVGIRESKRYEGIMLALANGQVTSVHFVSTEMAEAIEKGKLAHPQWSGKANLKQALLFLRTIQRMTAGPRAIRVAEMIRELESKEAPPAGS